MMLSTAIFSGTGVSSASGGARALSSNNALKCGQYAATCRSKRQCSGRWPELFGRDMPRFLLRLHATNCRQKRACGSSAFLENPNPCDSSDCPQNRADEPRLLRPGINRQPRQQNCYEQPGCRTAVAGSDSDQLPAIAMIFHGHRQPC